MSEQAHQPSIPSMLRCLAVAAIGGATVQVVSVGSRIVPIKRYGVGQQQSMMGRCVFLHLCIALRPFHWTAAGLTGRISTTGYIITRYVCRYRHSLEILPHSAQLRVGKLGKWKPTWICQKFCHAAFSLFCSSRVALTTWGC